MARISRISSIWVIFTLLASVCHARASHEKGFVTIKNNMFSINGRPFLFNGFNSYWLMDVGCDPSQRYKVSNVLQEGAAAGLSVCRTWAFNDEGYHALQLSPGVYDEQVFQSLDFAISEAGKHGIRLILTLVNNWNDYGGRAKYVQWAKDAGVQINNTDEFFTNSVTKDYYKNHVKKVLTRSNTFTGITYKDDPAIMAWELMNEPRCQTDVSGNAVHSWVEEMAAYIKSLDNKHLLQIGFEGFYSDSAPKRQGYNPGGYLYGTDFIKSNLIKEIDFATIHAYPDAWVPTLSDAGQVEFLKRWILIHWVDSRRILKKPLVLGEFGKSVHDPGYNVTIRDTFMKAAYKNIYRCAKAGRAIGGALVWQLFPEGLENYSDGYDIVLSRDTSTSSIIEHQSQKMRDLAYLIGHKRRR